MALGDAAVSSSIVAANPSSDCSRITVLEQQMAQLLSHLNQQVTLNTVLHEKLESALSQVAELSLSASPGPVQALSQCFSGPSCLP